MPTCYHTLPASHSLPPTLATDRIISASRKAAVRGSSMRSRSWSKLLRPLILSALVLTTIKVENTWGQDATGAVEFTAQQAVDGKTAYDRACQQCHGRNLDDGQFAPPLRGSTFNNSFAGKPVEELYTYISTKMPPA